MRVLGRLRTAGGPLTLWCEPRTAFSALALTLRIREGPERPTYLCRQCKLPASVLRALRPWLCPYCREAG